MSLGAEIGLDPGNIVLDGSPAPSSEKGAEPPFLAHVYCGETVTWMKMALGMEVGLGPGHIALYWDQVLPEERGTAPHFRPMSVVAKRLNASDTTWYGCRPQPRRHYVRWGPSSLSHKMAQPPPQFSANVYCGHGRQSQLLLSSCYHI